MNFLDSFSFDPNTIDPNDPNLALSPLADPVAGAIFANAEVAGLASESFINAVHKSENETGMKGKIIRVTPQRSHASPSNRGCRVDVETETDANEYYRYEIEIAPDSLIMVRDLFSASHFFVEKSVKGDTAAQMAYKMPKVIYINLLGYILRKTNTDLVQPAKFMYTKPPQEVAIDKVSVYNIQLPRCLDMKQDFTDDLFCWCYTMYTAHNKKMTVKEVVSMTPALQAYAERDTGFQQFCDRHETISADPQTRRDYVSWFCERLREEGMRDWIEKEAEEKIFAAEQKKFAAEQKQAKAEQKLAKAEKKRKEELLTSVRRMKSEGISNEIIARVLPISLDEITEL